MQYPDQFCHKDYNWAQRKSIGQGGFGIVYRVPCYSKKCDVAIKQMSMEKFKQQYQLQALKNQIQIMHQLSSQHTVRYFDHYIGKNYTYIISELCQKDLKEYLYENGDRLPEKTCANIFYELAQGFKVLVSKNYIHRDIKPQNILIKDGVFKISDFGFSRQMDFAGNSKIKEVCGTPLYMSPQMLLNQDYSAKCDIWSLGLMLYEMLFGYGPWPNKQMKTYRSCILSKPVGFPYGSRIHTNTKDFIQRALVVSQEKRMSWTQFFNHPFIQDKNCGVQVIYPQITDQTLYLLKRIQQSSQRKGINVVKHFQYYFINEQKLDKNTFKDFMKDIDPSITSYAFENVYQTLNVHKDGFIYYKTFKELFCDIDYRQQYDVASRRIEEIVAMARNKKLNLQQFFQRFDKNKNGLIQKSEFYELIQIIAPKISQHIIAQMWAKFDHDKSGFIDLKEFKNEITRGVVQPSDTKAVTQELTRRNLQCLRKILISAGFTAQTFVKKFDIDRNMKLGLQQFGPIIQKINSVITKQQIIDMFKYLDVNNSGSLQYVQIQQYLK